MTLALPDARYDDDQHVYTWVEFGIELSLERFIDRRGRDPDIGCELTVTRKNPDAVLMVGRRLWLGGGARAQISALNQKDDQTPWADIIEQACGLSKLRRREGDPLIDESEIHLTDDDQLLFALRPLMDARQPSLYYGDGGSGKSTLTMAMLLSIATGEAVLGVVPELRGPVLYLDWETDRVDFRQRISALKRGVGIDPRVPAGLFYRAEMGAITETAPTIRRMIQREGIVACAMDSLGMARGGDPESADATLAAFRAIRTLRVPTPIVDHIGKNTKDKSASFGSVYTRNQARLSWYVQGAQEENSPDLFVACTNYKRNKIGQQPRQGFKVHHEMNGDELLTIEITKTDVRDVPLLKETLTRREQIKSVLMENGAMAVRDLREWIPEATEASLRTHLNNAKGELFTQVTEDGSREIKWAVLSREYSDSDSFHT